MARDVGCWRGDALEHQKRTCRKSAPSNSCFQLNPAVSSPAPSNEETEGSSECVVLRPDLA